MEKNRRLKLGLMVGLLITLLVFIGGCAPAPGAEGGFNPTPIIIMVLIFGAFYFFMIRPQRRKQKEHRELIKELRRGDKIVTAGGIYGQIESLSQDSIILKIESGATMRVDRSSIVSKRGR